ncbi:MAG: prepilin peptidase [Candidatus Sumerlaeia bacterium]|nr:prepilin peptidase [Candidatus Sumerlaeia bacterium]
MTGLFLSPDLFPLHAAIVFLFGALVGSFLNVCIYRLPHGQSVNRPRRSFCPACGTMIAWYDNIPLVSYLALGGLCRHCGAHISFRYWVLELLTAVLFTAVFWVHGYTAATPLFLLLTGLLIIATFTDLDHWIIPDSISLGGAVLGIAAALALSVASAAGRWPHLGQTLYVPWPFDGVGAWRFAANSVVGAIFGFILLWLIGVFGALAFRKEAMGMGDMKLFACVGAFVGWQGCLLVLAIASFIGATVGLSLIAAQWIVSRLWPAASSLPQAACAAPEIPCERPPDSLPAGLESDRQPQPAEERRKGRQLHHLPFGPYIALACYVVALFHHPMTDWLIRHLFWLDFFNK